MKPFVRTGLAWTAVAAMVSAGLTAYTYSQMPAAAEIPVHWSFDGRADGFAPRSTAAALLMILPGSILFTGLVLALVPSLDPRKANIAAGRKACLAVWISTLLLLAGVHAGVCVATLRSIKGAALPSDFVRYIIAACGLLILIIGNYLPKTRPSFMFGIRTPWTLSSDKAWEKTHRFAGPLFMAAGALGMVGAFLFNGVWLAVQLSALIGLAALASVIYSYFAWKKADDHDAGTGLTI